MGASVGRKRAVAEEVRGRGGGGGGAAVVFALLRGGVTDQGGCSGWYGGGCIVGGSGVSVWEGVSHVPKTGGVHGDRCFRGLALVAAEPGNCECYVFV